MTKQEKKIAVIRKENKVHLLKFEEWLIDNPAKLKWNC